MASVDRQILAATAPFKNKRAGFVLTFGGDARPGTATRIAEIINAELLRVRPELFRGAVVRDYIQLSQSNSASVQIFLFT